MRRWFVSLTLGMLVGAISTLICLIMAHWLGTWLWVGVVGGLGLLVGCDVGLEHLKQRYQMTSAHAIFRLLNWA
ncbi:hypothetical protein KCA1_2056 [Lactiplantibacillus pentosus KCA1]|nr:hypothetical protein [Lactiplantibacillus pentosus]EIW13351.1 hypothetical protein KCA1_2056 [Lactiplantibacillus pentosus KCA1]